MDYGTLLRNDVRADRITPLIGVYDMFSASVAAQHYDGMFVSGFGFAASYYGLPDIGFIACRVTEKSLAASPGAAAVAPGVYFRVQLGGITGHGDFARDTGLLLRPGEAVAVSAAMIRVFAAHGDRTNRKKARLKYLLEKWGVEKFLEETQRQLAFPLGRLPLTACEARRPVVKHGWLGAGGSTQLLTRLVGYGRAMKICLTGETFDCTEADRLGIIEQRVGEGEEEDAARHMAAVIASHTMLATMTVKEGIRAAMTGSLDVGARYENDLMALAFALDNQHAGVDRFNKRKDE